MRGLLKRLATAWPARLLLLGAIWGMSFVLIKLGNRGFTPVQVSLGRMLFGLLAVAPVLLAGRGRLPRDARTWAHLAVAAALVNSVPFTLFAFGEQHVSSVLAGIWNGTTPLFVLVVVLLTLPEERPTRERAAGLALGFAGVLVVLGAWRGVAHGELVGSAACLAAAILYGIGFPYLRRHLATGGLTVPVLAFGQLAMGTLQLALIVPFTGGLPDAAPAVPLAAVAALGAVGTGAAYLLNYSIIRDAGATTASTVTYLVPVFATIAGVALLGEPLSWNEPVGGLLVLLGVAASQGRVRVSLLRPTSARV
jgi:drug/metabolite transporter (DMT)-like permease